MFFVSNNPDLLCPVTSGCSVTALSLKEHQLCVLSNEDNLNMAVNSMPRALVTCVLCVLTQPVPVRQQDGGAVEYMRQRRLDQLPAGDALDGL